MMGSRAGHAGEAAIRFHYDVGTEFYRQWLDPTLTYSAALWAGPADVAEDVAGLHAAQLRKLDFAVELAGARGAERVLDIGCGWGSLLDRLVHVHGVGSATGLTLSPLQARAAAAFDPARIEVALESFRDHRPAQPYDALCCIGAFEHFARPELSAAEKLAAYREFFERCHALLVPGGRMYLQTSAYGDAEPAPGPIFLRDEVFPESELPRLSEIVEAADRRFELLVLHNGRSDYERTLKVWARNLRRHAQAAAEHSSPAIVERYTRYLRLGAIA